MRLSQQEMILNHDRIVEGASRLIRERGIQNTSVADAMKAAGMTHGGFYRHFNGKDALLTEALGYAFAEFLEPLEKSNDPQHLAQAIRAYKAMYVSEQHVNHPSLGCPMPALGGELSRAGAEIKEIFSTHLNRLIDALAQSMTGSKNEKKKLATRELAMMVGAVLLARASNAQTVQTILEACEP